MRRPTLAALLLLLPSTLAAQSPAAAHDAPDGVMLQFIRFADLFGGRLVAAFDSIPAERYGYRPTPAQQTIGYIAQHLEDANYGLCERLAGAPRPRTAKDSLADTVKARWPKDTLVARLVTSLRYCDSALVRLARVESAADASTLLAFETDLAEHYSQLSSYMRLLGMVPPSALPPPKRTASELPAAALAPYPGRYRLTEGLELEVALQGGALVVRSIPDGRWARLLPESATDFFLTDIDARITFTRGAGGAVTGLVLHQFGRDRPAARVP
jgi:hypothetical protein